MTFQTDNINGKFFNVSSDNGGIDDLMWAGNSNDYHVGYHGRGHRARFYINWMTGEGTLWTKDEEELDDHGGDHGDDSDHEDDSGGRTNNMMSRPPILASVMAVVTTASAIFTLFY